MRSRFYYDAALKRCMDDFLHNLSPLISILILPSRWSRFFHSETCKSHLFLRKQLYGPKRIDEHTAPFYSEDFLFLSKITTSTLKLSYNRRFELNNQFTSQIEFD